MRDRLPEDWTPHSLQKGDSRLKLEFPEPVAVTVVSEESTYSRNRLCISEDMPFISFANEYYCRLHPEATSRLKVTLDGPYLRFGTKQGFLIQFNRILLYTQTKPPDSPPTFGNVAVHKATDLPNIPDEWSTKRGVFLCLNSIEAVGMAFFSGPEPTLVRFVSQGHNCLTGKKFSRLPNHTDTDYLVCPPTPSLSTSRTNFGSSQFSVPLHLETVTSSVDIYATPMLHQDMCFMKTSTFRHPLQGDWNLLDTPRSVGLSAGAVIYLQAPWLRSKRWSTQLLHYAISPDEPLVQLLGAFEGQIKVLSMFTTVGDLKENIASTLRVASEKQLLEFNGSTLSDSSQTLEDCGMGNDSCVLLKWDTTVRRDFTILNSHLLWDAKRTVCVTVNMLHQEKYLELTGEACTPSPITVKTYRENNIVPPISHGKPSGLNSSLKGTNGVTSFFGQYQLATRHLGTSLGATSKSLSSHMAASHEEGDSTRSSLVGKEPGRTNTKSHERLDSTSSFAPFKEGKHVIASPSSTPRSKGLSSSQRTSGTFPPFLPNPKQSGKFHHSTLAAKHISEHHEIVESDKSEGSGSTSPRYVSGDGSHQRLQHKHSRQVNNNQEERYQDSDQLSNSEKEEREDEEKLSGSGSGSDSDSERSRHSNSDREEAKENHERVGSDKEVSDGEKDEIIESESEQESKKDSSEKEKSEGEESGRGTPEKTPTPKLEEEKQEKQHSDWDEDIDPEEHPESHNNNAAKEKSNNSDSDDSLIPSDSENAGTGKPIDSSRSASDSDP
ncbi:hypothetical protein Pelo_16678 [Pelomyxa schiedti]|nr:hypothetical protein Pelo_16678 [Pelomyxa schiedti]